MMGLSSPCSWWLQSSGVKKRLTSCSSTLISSRWLPEESKRYGKYDKGPRDCAEDDVSKGRVWDIQNGCDSIDGNEEEGKLCQLGDEARLPDGQICNQEGNGLINAAQDAFLFIHQKRDVPSELQMIFWALRSRESNEPVQQSLLVDEVGVETSIDI